MAAAWASVRALRRGLAACGAAAGASSGLPAPCGDRPAWRAPGRGVFCEAEAKSLVFDWGDQKRAASLEAEYRKADVVRSRRELISILRPAAGERVLDVGCGPGFFLADLLRAEGALGLATGIDPSEAMVAMALPRASAASASGAVSLQVAGAEELPFPDASFDAVVFMQVLLYVRDVPRALREAERVLKPGGRLVVMDTDWDSLVVRTAEKERWARLFAACCSTFVEPHMPPRLPGLLAEAGLPVSELHTINMGSAGRDFLTTSQETFMGNWAFKVVPEKARAYGLPESDVEGWLQEQRALCDQGAFFACLHRFVFVSYKRT